jgi:hypothetical protein
MEPWFMATEKFGPWNGPSWTNSISRSGLNQLEEVVSLDPMLCGTVLPEIKPEYWNYIVNENFMLNFFTDLEFLLREAAAVQDKNVLGVFRNPPDDPFVSGQPIHLEFLGYDLMDVIGSASALTNCGGFPKAFSNAELTGKGPLASRKRAFEVRDVLRRFYPEDPHADCHVWAIFRAVGF